MSDVTGLKPDMAAIKASKKQLRTEVKNVLSHLTLDDITRQCRHNGCTEGQLTRLTV